MDLIKIGKYIAAKRKEKNLTQEKIGEKLGIGGKSVSKWERGLNMPDIEKLEQLCKILDVSVIDMLNGETTDVVSKDLNNVSFFDAIKYYIKSSKKFYFVIIFFVFMIALFSFSVLFMLNNYNKNQIYSIRSSNPYYEISGYLIFNQEQNILIMNDLKFQSEVVGTLEEPMIKNLNIFINYEDEKLMSYSENIIDEQNNHLSSVLDNLSFSIEENKHNNSNIIDYNTDVSKIKINIEYVTIEDKVENVELDMIFEELFSNNKFIY